MGSSQNSRNELKTCPKVSPFEYLFWGTKIKGLWIWELDCFSKQPSNILHSPLLVFSETPC